MHHYTLDVRLETGTASTLDPHITVQGWADQAHELPTLWSMLAALGWTHTGRLAGGTHLGITGPSGLRISLWQGWERSTVSVQLSRAWVGPLGVMTS